MRSKVCLCTETDEKEKIIKVIEKLTNDFIMIASDDGCTDFKPQEIKFIYGRAIRDILFDNGNQEA